MVVSVIFAVLFLTSLAIYLTGYIKKSVYLEKIPLFISVFLLEGISIPLLVSKLPDSLHVSVISSLAVFFTGLYVVFRNLSAVKRKVFENASLLIFYFFWIMLFNSIFYIHRVHLSISIIYAVFVLAVILFLILKLHIKNSGEAIRILIAAAFSGSLFYITLVTLIYEHNLYSVFCFLGSAGLSTSNILKLLDSKKENKQTSLPDNMVLVSSTIILLAGTVLMQF